MDTSFEPFHTGDTGVTAMQNPAEAALLVSWYRLVSNFGGQAPFRWSSCKPVKPSRSKRVCHILTGAQAISNRSPTLRKSPPVIPGILLTTGRETSVWGRSLKDKKEASTGRWTPLETLFLVRS